MLIKKHFAVLFTYHYTHAHTHSHIISASLTTCSMTFLSSLHPHTLTPSHPFTIDCTRKWIVQRGWPVTSRIQCTRRCQSIYVLARSYNFSSLHDSNFSLPLSLPHTLTPSHQAPAAYQISPWQSPATRPHPHPHHQQQQQQITR